jgi:4-hydroxybenzoate polyprenyltransferase
MKKYLKLMRVHHYIKNLLVFAALGCSGQLFQSEKLLNGIAGFLVFCMVSSAVYVINDIQDKEKDRCHPAKCKRPIASGEISEKKAWILMAVLVIIAFLFDFVVLGVVSTLFLLCYILFNLGYSMGLKNIPLLDVTILVAGFWIRVVYGAYITQIDISNWLYLTVIALAFYFALGKRRNERKQISSGETRTVLNSYPVSFFEKNMNMCLTLANVFYALWSMDGKTEVAYKNKFLIFTVPIVLLITMKYSLDVEGDSDGDPIEVLIHDKVLIVMCLLYFAVMFTILYLL